MRVRHFKASAPTVTGALTRTRLFERLDGLANHPAVWLHAPPGAGKTVAVATYLAARDASALWYRLDPADLDPATFVHLLASAVEGHVGGPALPRLTPEHRLGQAAFMARFFREVFARLGPTTLVLDDVQELGAADGVHAALARGLRELPPGSRAFLLSRHGPTRHYARSLASGELAVVGADVLAASQDEVAALATRLTGRAPSPGEVAALHARTQGWLAGIVLLVRAAGSTGRLGPEDSPLVDDYLRSEIYDPLPEPTRRLLLRVAFVESASGDEATTVSGAAEAPLELLRLSQANLFVSRYERDRFRLHPLLAAALRRVAERELSPPELRSARIAAADVLEARGELEASHGLRRDAGDVAGRRALVLRHAAALLEQGRHGVVCGWCEALPEVERDPWLTLWYGAAAMPSSPAAALPHLARSLAAFAEVEDAVGYATALAELVHAHLALREDARPLGALCAEADRWVARTPALPSAVEARLAAAMVLGLTLSDPGHAALAGWRARAEGLTAALDEPALKAHVLGATLFADFLLGDVARARTRLSELEPALEGVRPAQLLTFRVLRGALTMLSEPARCGALNDAALAEARALGAHLWDVTLQQHAAHAALGLGDLEQVRARVAAPAAAANLDRSQRHGLLASVAVESGDLAAALSHGQEALRSAAELGDWTNLQTQRLRWHHALRAAERLDEAERELARVEAEVRRTPASRLLAVSAGLARALTARASGAPSWRDALAAALTAAAAHGCWAPLVGGPRDALRDLLEAAIAEGVEADAAREMVARLEMRPRASAEAPPGWPWPLRIRLLGGLEIAVAGQRPTRPRTVPALLVALVAGRGRPTRVEAVMDAVWPWSDGDRAARAFRTALHRLRQLLTEPRAVVHAGGLVHLDPAVCWIDVWEVLRAAEAARRSPGDAGVRARAAAAAELARGELVAPPELGGELHEALEVARAQLERYRTKIVTA